MPSDDTQADEPSTDTGTGGLSNHANMHVIGPDYHDVSPPLTELVKLTVPEVAEVAHEADPVRPIPYMRGRPVGQVVDPVVQTAIGAPLIPATTVNFEGMGTGMAGFTVNSAPPDTDGDIGPNHYVQIVNSNTTIFNRAGGIVLGPVSTKSFWTGGPMPCANTNDGDGVVRYDRYANRWVISQFSVSSSGTTFFQCIAVSTTGDPTGSYARYQFSFNAFNDYPKMGLWRDGYYFTYNLFAPTTGAFQGARVCAANRTKMLVADPTASQICFDTGPSFGGLLPSDVDGPTLPPVGSPNYLVSLNTTALNFWRFHVDFATPASSTFIGPTSIPVAAYAPLCSGGTCVVQPGTTNRLDSLADRLMNRLVYRRLSYEALLVTHAVAAGTGGGVRFYELRDPATTPTIFQQGTYAPDSTFRWMSSAAFDGTGDIGLEFTTSSSTINPGIRYTGRLLTDPLGTMPAGEGILINGTGSQIGNLTRWGDYSTMNIDPIDDCTFWFTNEYMGASGSFNWRTRIGAFKLPTCGCINATFDSTDVPKSIPDNNTTGITSNTSVIGSGNASSLLLSLNITHTFIGDLVVTLIGPDGTQFIVSNRAGGGTDNLVITDLPITAFNGLPAAGTWKLKVQDLAGADVGTLNSWSLKILGNCVHWSGAATPSLPTVDNSSACTSLNVTTTGGDSAAAKLNISGSHDFCSILRGTLLHNGTTVEAFPTGTFPAGPCDFSFTNRTVRGLSGNSSGTWTLCIIDTDGFGDTGVLNSWAVHD
jgi:subtilisin-like proprotein convertase family protein